jgi:hypothetical protein
MTIIVSTDAKEALREAIHQLESRPHASLPGLRERYYYRGASSCWSP